MKTSRIFSLTLLASALAVSGVTAESPEAAALAVLASGADLHDKAIACQQLATVGGTASVPVLAALLDHERLSDYARSGLESIKDPAAGAALRKALGTLSGRHLAGAVNSLGVRRETAAVSELQKLAGDSKRGAATEALAALGLIGTADAAKALQQALASGPAELRAPAGHAALVAAAQLAKAGNSAAARATLDAIVRAAPTEHLVGTAKRQAAALK